MLPMVQVILKSLFKRPATVAYPKAPKINHELVRGHIEIDIEKCIFCGICQRKCPTGTITVDRAEKTWAIGRHDCIVCNSCVDNCPKKCLCMSSALSHAAYTKTEEIFAGARIPDNAGDN